MAFGFHAGFISSDNVVSRVTLADSNDDKSEHYFVMDRSEDSSEDAIPGMTNVYIERDDQQWGGFGGIDKVVLERQCLSLYLDSTMATKMGGDNQIRITFTI